jgi:hypothetical protein
MPEEANIRLLGPYATSNADFMAKKVNVRSFIEEINANRIAHQTGQMLQLVGLKFGRCKNGEWKLSVLSSSGYTLSTYIPKKTLQKIGGGELRKSDNSSSSLYSFLMDLHQSSGLFAIFNNIDLFIQYNTVTVLQLVYPPFICPYSLSTVNIQNATKPNL